MQHHISGHGNSAPIRSFGYHTTRLLHLAYGHPEDYFMDYCCCCGVESWCDPGGDIDQQFYSLEDHKRCMETSTPRVVMNGKAVGSRKQRKPEKWIIKGSLQRQEALAPYQPPLQGLVVSVKHHHGHPLFSQLSPPIRTSSRATAFIHSSRHTHLSICNVPEPQLRRLSHISLSLTLAPLLAPGECFQLPTS